MARFQHLLLVCQNQRDPDNPKGSCQSRGAAALLDRLKALIAEHRLKGRVRVTASGCLDYCARGCTVAAFSAARPGSETWYTRVRPEDADALFETHVLRGERLERLVETTALRREEQSDGQLQK